MSIITLTSDFGLKDYYVGLVKAALLSKDASLHLVDISHNVDVYDIVQGAFILKNCFSEFPEGTIHIISISNYNQKKPCFLAIRYEGHYFIGPDNGVFSLMFDEKITKDVYELDYDDKGSFPIKDTFAEAVVHLTSGKPLNEIGIPIESIEERITFQPVINSSEIRAAVIYIDNYENVVTNITRATFERVGAGRPFALYFKAHNPITKLYKRYSEVAVGEMMCFFNSAGCLEIAINQGKAASLHGLKLEDPIQVNFKED
ncbi:MAG: S-adenosyl-l-methionine hydroxide adenosyltransferase family protein [Saprospiraceae bacterium]